MTNIFDELEIPRPPYRSAPVSAALAMAENASPGEEPAVSALGESDKSREQLDAAAIEARERQMFEGALPNVEEAKSSEELNAVVENIATAAGAEAEKAPAPGGQAAAAEIEDVVEEFKAPELPKAKILTDIPKEGAAVGDVVQLETVSGRVLEVDEKGRPTRIEKVEPPTAEENPLSTLLERDDTVEVKPGTEDFQKVEAARQKAEEVLRARAQTTGPGVKQSGPTSAEIKQDESLDILREAQGPSVSTKDFEVEFAQSEKPEDERLKELDSTIDDSLKVMAGARLANNQQEFDTAARMFMKARSEAASIRAHQEAIPEVSEKTPAEELQEKLDAVQGAGTPEERSKALNDAKKSFDKYETAAREGRADRATTIDDRIVELRREIDRGRGRMLFDAADEKQELVDLIGRRVVALQAELEVNKSNPLESARIKDDLDKLKHERDELTRPPTWFGRLKKRTTETYQKIKEKLTPSKGVRGFLAERLKGMATVGFYEARQGERARTGTSAVAEELETGMQAIRSEVGENAEKTREYNTAHIEKTLAKAMAVYDEKMAKARTFMKGETAAERRAEVESRIRESLERARDNLLDTQKEDYVKVIRKAFDPAWMARYGVAALDAGLAGVAITSGLKYLAGKFIFGPPPPGIPPSALPPVPPGLDHAHALVSQKMNANIWYTIKMMAEKNGVHLTNPQLMELSKHVIADTSNSLNYQLYEPAWSGLVKGGISTHQMLQGATLKFSPYVMKTIGFAGH